MITIKEVEKRTALKKANIRFYEEQGLLTPKRNGKNNYREYDEEDIRTLVKIKCLRILGVPIQDIKRLKQQDITLSTLMKQRREGLKRESEEIEILKDLCSQLENRYSSFEDMDPAIVDMQSSFIILRRKRVLQLDKVYLMEKYESTFLKAWLVLFIIYSPLVLAVKFVIHRELPSWVQLPYYTFMLVTLFAILVLRYRARYYKKLIL